MSNRHRRDHSRRSHGKPEPELLSQVRSMLASDHPIDLLVGSSQFLEVMAPRPTDWPQRDTPRHPAMEELVTSLLEVNRRETTGLLYGLLPMIPSVSLAAEIHAELERRHGQLPDWVREIDRFEVTATAEMTHILGDGENVMAEVRWPSGRALTIVVYIDHNLGTVVKDAFPVPDTIDRLEELSQPEAGPDSHFGPIDAADARARIEQAITDGKDMFPPLTSDTWPGCRNLVEWVVRRLPQGGRGYLRPEWDEDDRRRLTTSFLSSPTGRDLAADPDAADIVDTIIWFACDYGPGDPLRWSPVAVEILLMDWFPRKIVADVRYLAKLPDVVRAFIRYAHRERSIPGYLTTETLEAVDRWEPEYRRAVARPTMPMELMQAIRGGSAEFRYEDRSIEEIMLASLAEQVGGESALDELDTAPVPDEELDWTGIPEDIHGRVGEVLEIADRCCNELLDVEYRTIVRRLLARAAGGDPDVFRRKARTDYAAAALVWTVGKANDLFRTHMLVKDLMAWFGISQGSVSQRAATLRKAAGISDPGRRSDRLGDPTLLHSAKRRSIVEWRDRYRERMS